MSTAHLPPRHRAAGPQGFGREPHPSGPIPVPAPRRGPGDDAVVRFPAPRRSPEGGDGVVTAAGPVVGAQAPPRFPATAPLPAASASRWRPPVGLTCALAVFLSVVASIVLVTLRTVPPSLPTPLPVAAPPAAAPPAPTPATAFGDGTFAVGQAIAPGAYRAPGGPGCHWSRLTPSGSVRASGVAGRVTIRPSDGAFRSAGCGVWR